MNKSISEDINDLYMYKFRTKLCAVRGTCKNPATCFDAHSITMRRRVPKYINASGLFNYIPEPCQQWERSKTCSRGQNCPLSHGWLEIIYHPLLYKTKLCKSQRHDGVCTEYGVYCAKAHSRCEIRSLVYTFGEDWKRHYDLSTRFGFQRAGDAPRCKFIKTRRYRQYRKRIGQAVAPKGYQMLDLNIFANYLLEKQTSTCNQSLEQKLKLDEDAFEFNYPHDKSCSESEEQVGSEIQIDLGKSIIGETSILEREPLLKSADVRTQSISDNVSTVQDKSKSLCRFDTNSMVPCGKGLYKYDEHVEKFSKTEKEFYYDRMPKNWFLSTCHEKASEVFQNRLL